MDTEKWKSVLVPIEIYREIKTISKAEGRTISGQLRLMFEIYKKHRETARLVPYNRLCVRHLIKFALSPKPPFGAFCFSNSKV